MPSVKISVQGLVLGGSLVFVPACGATFVRPTPVPGKSELIVYRPYKWIAGAISPGGAISTVNDQVIRAFPVRMKKRVATDVPAGPLRFTWGTMGRGAPRTIGLDMPDQGVAYVRCEAFFVDPMSCTQVAPELGERESSKTKWNVRGD